MSKELRLDIGKIEYELGRIGQTKAWLAKQIKFSPQRLHILLQDARPVHHAAKLARVFELDDPKYLVTSIEVDDK